jgi:chorismate--pyruvate lyase
LRWQPRQRYDNIVLPARVRSWLLDEGSLTERLIVASGGRFRVRVIGQSWARPLPGERRALGMREHAVALVREVFLECAGEPWVYARSILPARSLEGALRHLRRFGARSLGAQLFSQRNMQREEFTVAHLTLPGGVLWARRSVFHVHDRPLLVQEVFLPACRLGSL